MLAEFLFKQTKCKTYIFYCDVTDPGWINSCKIVEIKLIVIFKNATLISFKKAGS